MLKPRYLQEIQTAVDHLVEFTDTNAKWGERFEDFMQELFRGPARRLNCGARDINTALLDSVWLDEVWPFLTHEAAVTRWNNESGSMVTDYLKKRGSRESAVGRAYLRALDASEFALWQILQVEPNGRLTLHDPRQDGQDLTVVYPPELAVGVSGDWFLGRVLDMGKTSILADSVLLLPPALAARLQEELSRIPAQLHALYLMMIDEGDVDSLPEAQDMADEIAMWQATALCEYSFEMWTMALLGNIATNPEAYIALNSDDHPIAVTRDRFALQTDSDALVQRLNQPPEFASSEYVRSEFGLIWNWSRHSDEQFEHLGRFELFDDCLEMETNSIERAERGNRLLRDWLGDAIGAAQRQRDDMEIYERMAATLVDTRR